jgi:hypothetical protein
MPCYYFEVEICTVPQWFQLFIGFVHHNTARAERQDMHVWGSKSYGKTYTERKVEGVLLSNRRQIDPLPEEYATGFREGDVVGCGYDFKHEIVFYTINGKRLGKSTRSARLPIL